MVKIIVPRRSDVEVWGTKQDDPPQKSVSQFAEELSDAYSTSNYRNGWGACIKLLRRRYLDDRQIEAIIRSKWTRWAADASNKRYGSVSAVDLINWMNDK